MPRLSDADLLGIIAAEVQGADVLYTGEVAQQQATAMEYYLGEPFGNEVRGRSSIVMSEVSDVVESVLPSLLRIFTAGDEIVRFEPTGVEDQAVAKQRTDYANYVFMRDNPGFSVLYTWCKDALIQKVGVVKAWWDRTEHVSRETYDDLDDLQFTMLLQGPDITIVEHEERPDPIAPGAMRHDVTLKVRDVSGKIRIENVPPEEFLISRDAISILDARYVGHRTPKRQGELIGMGYSRALVERLPTYHDSYGSQRLARFSNDLSRTTEDTGSYSGDPSMRPVTIIESYLWVDRDGDDEAELLKITTGEAGTELLDEEPWPEERAPFYSICPIPLPHRFYGLSQADLVMDLQLIKSTLIRQILDNLYVANNGRTAVDINKLVDLDDVLISRPNQVIRVMGPASEAVFPIPHVSVPSQTFNMVEYLDSVREIRTGITRYNQGLDANSLNKTASGISQIMAAAQQRIELIARIFAETGIRELFEGIDALTSRYQDRERMIRLRNEWITVDPRDWKGKMDATVHVGLGTSNKTEMTQSALGILAMQEKLIVGGKPYMVTDRNIFSALTKLIEFSGLKGVESYFTPPPDQPPPAPPSPEAQAAMAELEIEKAKLQLAVEKAKAEMQLEREKAENEIAIARMKAEAEIALQRDKMLTDARIRAQDVQMKAGIVAMKAVGEVSEGRPNA